MKAKTKGEVVIRGFKRLVARFPCHGPGNAPLGFPINKLKIVSVFAQF